MAAPVRKKSNGAFCAAYGCSNSQLKNRDLHFFRFPTDKDRCKRWVINSKREDLISRKAVYLNINCRMCSVHFEDNAFMDPHHSKLRPDAVPRLFLTKSLPRGRKLTALRACKPISVSVQETATSRMLIDHNYAAEVPSGTPLSAEPPYNGAGIKLLAEVALSSS